MSLQAVADLSQMSKTHIWDIEQGKSPNMTVRTILKISFALKTTPSNLLQFDFVDSTLTDQEIQIALAAREIYRNPLQTTP
jgi:transcriptional regulator with XRE-family HTH domain